VHGIHLRADEDIVPNQNSLPRRMD